MTRFTPKFIEVLRNSVDGWQRDNNPLKVSSKTEYDYDGFIGDLGEALDEIESLQSQLSEARAENANLKTDLEQMNNYADEMHQSVLDWELQLSEARARLAWIPVSERLPENEEEVLLFADQSGLFIATFHDASSGRGIDTFETDGDDMAPVFHPDSSVLYWMPKPEAPKEDE